MHRLIGDDLWNLLNTTYGGRLAQRVLADFSPSAPAELQVFSRHEVGPATFLRQAAERLKNTHALDDVHSALCQVSACVFAVLAYFPVAASSSFSAAAAQVTANWLKPLKFPECAACIRRVGQLELPSNKRSCMSHANFLNPTTLIS